MSPYAYKHVNFPNVYQDWSEIDFWIWEAHEARGILVMSVLYVCEYWCHVVP